MPRQYNKMDSEVMDILASIEGRGQKYKYMVIWLKKGEEVKSFRVETIQRKDFLQPWLAKGWKRIPDPFRKGAPVGGYDSALRGEEIRKVPLGMSNLKGESYDITSTNEPAGA